LARIFTGTTAEHLQTESGVVSALPFTVSVWGWADNLTTNHTLFWLGDPSGASLFHAIDLSGATANDPARAFTINGTSALAVSGNSYNANAWNHVGAIFNANADRSVMLNGGTKVNDTTSKTMTVFNRTCLGRRADSTPSDPVTGRIAECGVWNVALSDAELLMLSKGFSPLQIRPESLIAYWPILGRTSPEIDLVGRLELTVTGPPLVKEHPRIIYPFARWTSKPAVAGGAVSGSLSVTLGALTASASGTVEVAGTVARTLGTLTSASAGAVAVTGATTATLGAVTLVAAGSVGAVPILGALSSTLGAVAALATGAVAVTGVLARTLASLVLQATDHPLAPTPEGRTAHAGAESRIALARAENRTEIA